MSTQPKTKQNLNSIDALGALLNTYGDHINDTTLLTTQNALMLVLAVVQVVQRTFAGSADFELQKALVTAIQSLLANPASYAQFPIMSTVLSNTYAELLAQNDVTEEDRPAALLEAVFTFLDATQHSGAEPTEAVLRNIVAKTWVHTTPTPAVSNYPEVNFRANVLKIFKPAAVSLVDLEPLYPVVYRGELKAGGFGPELWGLAYIQDDTAHLLLETGEYVIEPANSLTLAISKEYDISEIPPYLLACAKLFMPAMLRKLHNEKMPEELNKALAKLDKNLGVFTSATAMTAIALIPAEAAAACEPRRDNVVGNDEQHGEAGLISPAGAYRVTVVLRAMPTRAFITATLVDPATNAILMRLDTPREFSAQGIYFFPLGDKSAGLIVV